MHLVALGHEILIVDNLVGRKIDDELRSESLTKISSISDRVKVTKSILAVTGIYFYDNSAIEIARGLVPSTRGELEITEVNNKYIRRGKLRLENLGRGFAWLDTGTHQTLLEASQFVETIENRQGLKIACLEEITFRKKWLSKVQLEDAGKLYQGSPCGRNLRSIIQ